eukprot:scaffold429534_cov83-Attheya_sp.AAC.1
MSAFNYNMIESHAHEWLLMCGEEEKQVLCFGSIEWTSIHTALFLLEVLLGIPEVLLMLIALEYMQHGVVRMMIWCIAKHTIYSEEEKEEEEEEEGSRGVAEECGESYQAAASNGVLLLMLNNESTKLSAGCGDAC